jgi:hypothetical protein
MTQIELCDLMTVQGFYQFLSQQAQLPTEDVTKIYLLGRPWGVWPPDIDVRLEAEQTGIDVFTYLAALQPLVNMDTEEKEAELVAYEMAVARGDGGELSLAVHPHIKKVAALAKEQEQTICDLLHALYRYRQRVGELSIQKMIGNKTAAIARLQKVIEAEIQRRCDGSADGP